MLQARVGEEALSSGKKAGMTSEVWSELDLGGDTQLLSGELAEVIAAEIEQSFEILILNDDFD